MRKIISDEHKAKLTELIDKSLKDYNIHRVIYHIERGTLEGTSL